MSEHVCCSFVEMPKDRLLERCDAAIKWVQEIRTEGTESYIAHFQREINNQWFRRIFKKKPITTAEAARLIVHEINSSLSGFIKHREYISVFEKYNCHVALKLKKLCQIEEVDIVHVSAEDWYALNTEERRVL